jgi:Ser/Thr protein kinase RdoA (MazF antagonist)
MDLANNLFLGLTPEKVLAAVEAAGLRCNPVCYPLNSFENRVYEVELADRTRVVAKFYRPGRWSDEQILDEHRFLADLDAEEVPVTTPRPFPDGETLRRVDHIPYALFERRGGRAPDELDEPTARRLGRLAARLHNVGARRDAPHRLRLTGDAFGREDLAWLSDHDLLPAPLGERYAAAATAIADAYDDLARGVPLHRLHGDLHLGNLLLRGDLLWVVDFDDMVVGPAVQDLWLALPGRDAFTARLRESFLEGYEELRAFDRSTLRLVEPLRGLRIVHYSAWLARRWHDPIFPATWPHFGSFDYWRSEVEALEEIVTLVRRQDPLAPEPEETPELSNKDLFWDWEE